MISNFSDQIEEPNSNDYNSENTIKYRNSRNNTYSSLKNTFDIDLEKAQKDAEALLQEGEEVILIKEKSKFESQSINLNRIYNHLFYLIDWIFLILAIIGSIGAGISLPIISYLNAEVFGNIGNTPEIDTRLPPAILQMIYEKRKNAIHESMNKSIKRQLIYGSISFICNFMYAAFWSLIGNRCSYNLKKKYFTVLLSQEQDWFDSYNTYELTTKVQAQLEQIELGIGMKVGLVISSIVQFISGFVFAFISCWKVSLVMVCIVPFIIIFYIVMSRLLRKGIIISRKTWEIAGGLAEELLYNIKTVASFANFEYELTRFFEKVEIVWRIDLINTFKLGIFNGLIIFLFYLCIFICFLYGRTLVGKELNIIKGRDLNGGDIFSTALCILIALGTIQVIAPNIKGIQESCAAASDYFNLYDRKPQMDYSQSIERPPISQIQGRIEFQNVNFYYPSDSEQKLVLNGINLTFEPGKKIALVGESGCGKSTTVNLIERLYDITGGQLLIDGIEIKRYDIEYLRNFIGYVQQEPVLFNASIRKNIIFGRDEYLQSIGNIDELIQNACDDAYASEFINNFEDGIDYVVGIKGNKLSGGQRQRIAIARAILAKPKILILDEATSALDSKSEKEVQRALDNISKSKITTIIIAHRLQTIKNADLIYVLKDGNILEKGTHSQLLEINGYYSRLVASQLVGEGVETKNKEEEMKKEKTNIKRRNTDDEIQFEKKDNAVAISEKDIPIKPCAMLGELSDFRADIFLSCLGALIVGIATPFMGFAFAKTIIPLNSQMETKRYDHVLKRSFIYLALALLQGIGYFIMQWKFMSIGLTLARIYRKKLMKKYLSFHISYFDVTKNSPGSLLTRLSIDTIELNQMIYSILGLTIQCGCIFIVEFIIGCLYDYRLLLINFSFVPIIALSNFFRRQLMESSSKRSIQANIEAGGILSECVTNTKTIFSFNFKREAIQMYLEIIEYVRQQFVRDGFLMGLLMAIGSFCQFAANCAVYAAARNYIVDGSTSSEEMTTIMNTVNVSVQEITYAFGELGNLRKAIVALRSIYSSLYTSSLINPFGKDNKGKISAMNIKGKIELRHVYFAYPTRPENVVLEDVSFTIMPGQKVGLAGSSGCGKSTIIQLLNRFYDIEDGKGEILIDDINIKDYNLYELRKKIGWVSQESTIFKISPLENVRYGRLDASDNDCIEAAKEANIMKFFTEDQINKVINEKREGDELKRIMISEKLEEKFQMSGGEKQRLCIARTFLKNPTILLLDEATSSLDRNSELEVQKSLDKLATNRTCISVSHRLSTFKNYDQIFVMNKGRLVEQGTHKELMKLKKIYYAYYRYSTY